MIRLHSLFGLVTKSPDRRAGRPPRPAAFRPTLETLEARETPSSLAHATDFNEFLFVSDAKGQGFSPVLVVGHGHNVVTYVAGY
jgi:hypothetical protein